ncbi:MAG: PEGA domain-containing protein [Candidatus Aminicenantaceae bacterium]
MKCGKCGNRNTPGSGFCNRCGAELQALEKPHLKKKPKTRAPKQRREKAPSKSRGGGLMSSQYSIFFIFILVLLGVVIVGALFMIPKGEDQKPELIETGALELSSIPTGAEVFLDNERQGTTPFQIEMDPGSYSVRLVYPEYQDKTEIVQVRPGETTMRVLDLAPSFIIQVPANPPEANVKIDGKFQGKTPLSLPLTSASVLLQIEKDGWSSWEKQVELKPGINLIEYSLSKEEFRLRVRTTPAGARVFLDNRDLGPSPVTRSVGPGSHELRLEMQGYRPEKKTIEVQADAELTYTLYASETVTVKISVSPWAEVFLDGKSIGVIPPVKDVPIEAGPHTLEFIKGEQKYSHKVEIKAEGSKRLHMDMATGELREIG